MFHGYRRFVSLALSVCCILSMLFLDTYDVKAQTNISDIVDQQLGTGAQVTLTNSFSIAYDKAGFSWLVNGTKQMDTLPNGTLHIHMPVNFNIPVKDGVNISPNKSYGWYMIMGGHTLNGTYSNKIRMSNIYFSDADGHLLAMDDNKSTLQMNWYKGSSLLTFDGNWNTQIGINGFVDYDLVLDDFTSLPDWPDTWTIETNFIYYCGLYSVKAAYDNTVGGQSVIDIATVNELQDLNSTTEDTNTTTHSIFDSISSFFASFFQNVIDSFKSLFIPEDGYFTTWFNRLNTLLADKLGMLYAPFDLVISTLTAIMNADSTETGIPFPGIKWDDTWLIEPFTFTFSSLGEDMSDLRDTVYFATDVVLLFAFLYLLEEKIRHILED